MKTYLTEISNVELQGQLRQLISEGATCYEIASVFRHRYEGGQVDYGIVDNDGEYFVWAGGNCAYCANKNDINIIEAIELQDIVIE